ncbi:MAG: tetratricopeptide repeat protein [Coleofasciculus sp.]|uniref:O-linked N-acetylglucosamine transferase, SPINDLY family protein n=1 Tax=Coleofasciculus sp. TaxID=3100458 RepID=UPI003A17F7A0
MTAENFSAADHNWQRQAAHNLIQGDYSRAASLYEQAIEAEPDVRRHYWHLGLLLLLQGQEAEAQTTWFLAMAEAQPEQLELWTTELLEVLEAEAQRREELEDYAVAWAIRQHIREIHPSELNNLLQIIALAIKLQTFTGNELTELGVIELLQTEPTGDFNGELLLQVLEDVLDNAPLHPASLEFTEACLPYFPSSHTCLCILLPAAMKIGHTLKYPGLAARFLELYLRVEPDNLEALRHLATFYQDNHNYSQGIETAKLCYSLSQTLPHKIAAIHLVLRGLMNAGGYWQDVLPTCEELESLLLEVIETQPRSLPEGLTLRLLTPFFALPHVKDKSTQVRPILNQVAQVFQANIQTYSQKQYSQQRFNFKKHETSAKPLKIGYLSHCLRRHSVGWLARWLLQHHDRERFQVHGYFVNYKLVNDSLQEWYVNQVDYAHKLGMEGLEIAEQIYQDNIDILIDLDSITLDISCEVMALKPAPVQVTWLGWDASGIPAIDYFIADPYVLPNSAEDYYSEKLWRLPQTYIAVDGFEVGVPTLRRDELNIPSDAVVYLSSQRGYKRHPDTIRWQMKILKAVPNSYFLIKGKAEEESIKNFFNQIAEEEEVSCERLRFLPIVASEAVHRANLGIADVVLDTYPYNGATTTLETLWMGIPIVTRVGEQFAARNSYTMMMNAGITEGIAWTDEEYIEWGIRLGTDPELRQQISWKLRQSKHTSPLWNAKQFTREMEKAYEQMWTKYVEGNK